MKLICERDHLSPALSLVIGHAKGNSNIPILQHTRLTAQNNGLRLCATDLDATSESKLAAEVSEPGAVVIHAHRFAKLISGFPKGSQIGIQTDKSEVTLKCGRSTYRLPTMPLADWPEMQTHQEPTCFTLEAPLVKGLFETPLAAVEPPKGRIYLTGGYLHQPAPNRISVASTDGHILIRYEADCSFAFPTGVIVPKAAMSEIAKIATGTVKFECTANLIVAETEACRFTSKLIDATYPDYQRVIPDGKGASILVDRENLITAVRRLDALSEDRSSVKLDWRQGDGLTATLSGNGSGEENIDAEVDLASIGGIGVSPSLIIPALEAFPADVVRIFITDAGAAIRIEEKEPGSITAVVMPMRLT